MGNPRIDPRRSKVLISSDVQLTGSRQQPSGGMLLEQAIAAGKTVTLLGCRRANDTCADFLGSTPVWVLSEIDVPEVKQVTYSNQTNRGFSNIDCTLFVEVRVQVTNGQVDCLDLFDKVKDQRRPLWHVVDTWPQQIQSAA